jgi:hypothetical protein
VIPVGDERRWELGVSALVVAGFTIRVFLGLRMESPFLFYDEMIGPGVARFLTGSDIVLYGVSGRPLYGILLAPVTLVTADPIALYRYALLLNAALFSALPALLYHTSRRVFLHTRRGAFMAAALGSAGAATFAYSTMLLPEALLTVLATLSVPVVHRFFEEPGSWARMVAVVVTGALLSATHERAVVSVIAMALAVAWAALSGRSPRRPATVVIVGLLLAYAAVETLSEAVNSLIYVDFGPPVGGPATILRTAAENPELVLRSVIGTSWYLVASTLGLAVVGLFGLVLSFERLPHAHPTIVYVALTVLGAGALSALFVSNVMVNDGRRVDAFAYGRYVDHLLPVVAMFIPIAWASVRVRTTALVASVGITGVGSFVAARVYEPQFWDGPNAQHNVPGIHWLRHLDSVLAIDRLGVPVMLAVGAVLVVSALLDERLPVGVFALIGVIAGSTFVVRWAEHASAESRSSSKVAVTIERTPARAIAVPIDAVSPLTLQLLTFWAPNAPLRPVPDAARIGDSFDWVILPDRQHPLDTSDGEADAADLGSGLVLWRLE